MGLTKKYKQDKNGIWVAYCDEVGVSAYGNTKEEAEEMLNEFIELQIETIRKLNAPNKENIE